MTDKNALEPVATVTVRSIGGDTVDTIPGRDYVLAQDAAEAIAKLEQEAEENARIIGMSGEREAKHLSMIEQRDRRIAELEAALAGAESWLSSSQHGDNCFVSDNYEGDPGDRCNCGKDSLLAHIDAALKSTPTPDPRDARIKELEAALAVRDAYPQAHRLAMELECFMLSCTDTAVAAKWWDSANEALEQWREFNAAQGADALKGAPTEKGGSQ